MKRVKLSLLVLMAWITVSYCQAQATQKVLYITASRTTGQDLSTALRSDESFCGPVLNLLENRLYIGNASVLRSRIKGIRFDIREEEIPDAIEAPETSSQDEVVYDLQGRQIEVQDQVLSRGIYIKGGKKYLKR